MARLNVKLPRLSLEWLSGLGGRRFALYALYTVVLFLVFLLLNFPHSALIDRALQLVNLDPFNLDIADTRFAWWNGYEFRGVRLVPHGAGPEEPAVLESSQLYVRPVLSRLVRGQLNAVSVNGSLYSGALEGTVEQRNGAASVRLRFDRLQLARYPFIARALESGELGGLLSGALSAEARRGSLSTLQGTADVNLKSATLIGAKASGTTIPDLHFSSGTLKVSIKGGRLEVQTLQLDGDEVKVQGSGQIVLREAILDSVLNLRMSVEPGATGADMADLVIAFLNAQCRGGKGSRDTATIALSGTLAQPRCR